MSNAPSFHALTDRLQAGDPHVADQVFRRFAHRLIGLASRRLGRVVRGKVEPEDVIQSVFRSFFLRQREGQFDLHSWDDLWDVLVVITLRKCCNRAAFFQAACRDARREVAGPPDGSDAARAAEVLDREPTPLEAAQLADTTVRLLGRFALRERTIVELRLEGYPILEICERVDCSERKVYRVLKQAGSELRCLYGADELAEEHAHVRIKRTGLPHA